MYGYVGSNLKTQAIHGLMNFQVYLGSKVISLQNRPKWHQTPMKLAYCHIAEEHNTSVRKGSGVPLLIKHQVGPSNKKLGQRSHSRHARC